MIFNDKAAGFFQRLFPPLNHLTHSKVLPRSIIFILVVLSLLAVPAMAAQYTVYNATGLGYTAMGSDLFMVANANVSGTPSTYGCASGSTGGCVKSMVFDPYSAQYRLESTNMVIYAMSDPTQIYRMVFVDAYGNIGYTDTSGSVDYSLGWYDTTLCPLLGISCNPMYRITTLTADGRRKFDIDPDTGDIYTNGAGRQIIKLTKASAYAQSNVYLVPGDTYETIDIKIGSDGNLHVLNEDYNPGGNSHLLYKRTVTKGGSLVSLATGTFIHSQGDVCCGNYGSPSIVPDASDPEHNYTWAGKTSGKASIYHNTSAGTETIVASDAAMNSVGDLGYNAGSMYLSSPSDNIVKSYTVTYEGGTTGGIPTNPSISGTIAWVNEYNTAINTIEPGLDLKVHFTLSSWDSNYSYYASYGAASTTTPSNMLEKIDITSQNPNGTITGYVTYSAKSDAYTGQTIWARFLSQHKTTGAWYVLGQSARLQVTAGVAGYDSIVLNKFAYNNTGFDDIRATFTYGDSLGVYKWMLCDNPRCTGVQFGTRSLLTHPSQDSFTNTLPIGHYYAVMLKGLVFPEVVAFDDLIVQPPVTGVRWHKPTYNIPPADAPSNSCTDPTNASGFYSLSNYMGFATGYLSCSGIPDGASRNNSVMQVDFFSLYPATVYLNNSVGNVFNLTGWSGNATLLYILTRNSTLGQWMFYISENGNSTSAITEVLGGRGDIYRIWFTNHDSSGNAVAYKGETLGINWQNGLDGSGKITLEDAAGMQLKEWTYSNQLQDSETFFINPAISYNWGVWTARLFRDQINYVGLSEEVATATISVYNNSRPTVTPTATAPGQGSGGVQDTQSNLIYFMGIPAFWGAIFLCLTLYGLAQSGKVDGKTFGYVTFVLVTIFSVVGLFDPYRWYVLIITWLLAGIFYIAFGRSTTTQEG